MGREKSRNRTPAPVVDAEELGRQAAERGELNDITRQLAAQGHAIAQNNLGVIYEHGYGDVEQDFAVAARWYRKSAEQGFPMAHYNLAVLYEYGRGVDQSESKALEFYTRAAHGRYAAAQYVLGGFYRAGKGVPQDLAQALQWYDQAARQDYPNAAQMVAATLQDMEAAAGDAHGSELPELLDVLSEDLRRAAEQGDPLAQSDLAEFLCEVGDLEQAVIWFRRAAENGVARAQYNLGVFFENGHGISRDLVKAVHWYDQAAQQGYLNAMYNLAFLREHGYGCARDLQASLRLYQAAANQNETDSQFKLALLLLDDSVQRKLDFAFRHEGWAFLPADHGEARRLLKQAAQQGHASSAKVIERLGWQ